MKDKHYSSSSSLALKTLYECVRTLNILVSKTGKKLLYYWRQEAKLC